MKDKNTAAAQTYLREKCGAYRGHPEWRALEQAFLAGAESACANQCLHQIQEPPTKTEALAHYSQQAILAMSEAGGQDALPLAAYLCIEESGAIDFEVLPPCTLPPGEYDLYAKSRTTQAAQQGGDKQ